MRRIEWIVGRVVAAAAMVALGIALGSAAYAQPPDAAEAVQPPAPQGVAPGGAPPVAPGPMWQGPGPGGPWQGAGPAWQGQPMPNQWQRPMAGWQGQMVPGVGGNRAWMPGQQQPRQMVPGARQMLLRRGMAARQFMQQRPALRRMVARPQALQQQLFRGIRLDEAQRTRVREINQQHRAGLQSLNKSLADARRTLNQARTADTLDEAALRQSASAVATAEADLAIARNQLRTDLLSVLTPDQQKTVAARRQLARDRLQRLQQRRQPPESAPVPRKQS